MNNIKEIKSQINSIASTQKITRTMEMVAISKMRKIEKKMKEGRPYIKVISSVIDNILEKTAFYQNLYLRKKQGKNISFIVISTDKGLCGGLNTNLFKKVLSNINYFESKNFDVSLGIIGNKGVQFFKSSRYSIVSKINALGKKVKFSEIFKFVSFFLNLYKKNSINQLFLFYNHFHTKILQVPQVVNLLPIFHTQKYKKNQSINKKWDYLYEPNSRLILDELFNNYAISQVYHAVLENLASEQASRMFSMKTARENSNAMIKKLKIMYNKVRQNKITQELIEIVSGASVI